MEPYGILVAVISAFSFQLWSMTDATLDHINITCEYEEMTDLLHDLAENYSNIARLESIGKTVEGTTYLLY